ncbi:MAG: LodA/GoxA family CTQ-dependent oxidase, partial [Acidobacteriota bacterium]
MPDKADKVVRCAIHPSVGVARVGNAPADEYYLAPEVPGRASNPGPQGYKNADGQLRKEAARFRIYGYDKKGNVVREITASDPDVAEITWEVHLANRKPAWYQFMNAMDLKQYALSTTYRNGGVTGELRQALVNDPGAIRISGRNTHGSAYRFDQGFVSFPSAANVSAGVAGPYQVPLGELRTDGEGRLIVLGGDGKSASAGN